MLIGTSSNALMTLELDDDDYGIMPLSSVGTATNTIDWNGAVVQIGVYDKAAQTTGYVYKSVTDFDSSGMRFKYSLDGTAYDDDKYVIRKLGFVLTKSNIPVPGDYFFSWDVSSNFSYDMYTPGIWVQKIVDNASDPAATFNLASTDYAFSSGDFACLGLGISLGNVSQFVPAYWIQSSSGLRNLDFSCRIGFNLTSGDYPTVGTDTSTQDYQAGVSSSLSDLSSSVDEVSEGISGITDAIENLQGAMEPHYSNVLTQLHHITEQLHAFYDQVYNNIHLAQMTMLENIKTAIENIDLEVEVNLDKLKTSIDNMSTAIQNKLQSVQDAITNGFNSAKIDESVDKLDDSLYELENTEEQLTGMFEYLDGGLFTSILPDDLHALFAPFALIASFVDIIILGSGEMSLLFGVSILCLFCSLAFGMYRFRG